MDPSFENLLGVSIVAFTVPFVLGFLPRVRIPTVVVELLVGVLVGPAMLGWVHPDEVVSLMATLGVSFLLFLAGLELDLGVLRGRPLKLGGIGFLCSVVIALAALIPLGAADIVLTPSLVAIALSATSVGIVIPALRDAGRLDSPAGLFTVAGGSVAEVGTIAMLAVLFSTGGGSPALEAMLLVVVAGLALVALRLLRRFAESAEAMRVFLRLDESSSQVRVRLAVVLMLAAVVIATRFGFEAILGAFLAGAVLAIVVSTWEQQERFRSKVEAVGFGFFVPVFFITSGMNFDLWGLLNPAELVRIPLFLAILLAARALPALLYRKDLSARETAAAGLLQATNLSFIVVVAHLGAELGEVRKVTGDALITAGLLSALLFPALASRLLGRAERGTDEAGDAESDEAL